MRHARRQAREVALQALYAWQLSGGEPLDQVESIEELGKKDLEFLKGILGGVVSRAAELETRIRPHLSRDFAKLSPVERAILFIGAYELEAHPETPFKVVLNEAVELGKSFGGNEGYRFVNGVLEKIAQALRPEEVARSRKLAWPFLIFSEKRRSMIQPPISSTRSRRCCSTVVVGPRPGATAKISTSPRANSGSDKTRARCAAKGLSPVPC